jgi:hypothetical protein
MTTPRRGRAGAGRRVLKGGFASVSVIRRSQGRSRQRLVRHHHHVMVPTWRCGTLPSRRIRRRGGVRYPGADERQRL